MRISWLLGLSGLVAAGCATIHNPLSPQDVAALRIVEIRTTFEPGAAISWAAAEQEFVDQAKAESARSAKGRPKTTTYERLSEFGAAPDPAADEHRRLVASPEGKEYVRKRIVNLIESRLRRDVAPQLAGTRDVHLELNVVGFIVPHVVQRVVLGGTPVLGAITRLKDARTGAELAKLDQGASTYAGQGLAAIADQAIAAPLEERLVDAYVTNVRQWLWKR